MTRNQIFVLILALCLLVVANEAKALPDNYCTADQKTSYITKIEKIDTLLTAWNLVNTEMEQAPPLTQNIIRQDARYVKMKNLVTTVNQLKTDYTDTKNACVLQTDTATGKQFHTTTNNLANDDYSMQLTPVDDNIEQVWCDGVTAAGFRSNSYGASAFEDEKHSVTVHGDLA